MTIEYHHGNPLLYHCGSLVGAGVKAYPEGGEYWIRIDYRGETYINTEPLDIAGMERELARFCAAQDERRSAA